MTKEVGLPKLELDVVDGKVMYIKWPFLIKHVNGKLEFSRKGVFMKRHEWRCSE